MAARYTKRIVGTVWWVEIDSYKSESVVREQMQMETIREQSGMGPVSTQGDSERKLRTRLKLDTRWLTRLAKYGWACVDFRVAAIQNALG